MIQSFINTSTPLVSNTSSVQFQNDCIVTNSARNCNSYSWLCHNEGSANYDIVKGGLYEIDFDATISALTAGTIAFQLFSNGEPITGTLMAETIAAAGDTADIGINKKIKVCCNGNTTISVRSVPLVENIATPATPITTQVPTILNANFSISKKA